MRTPRTYLLTSGLAVCGVCRANLLARARKGNRRAYVCASGPGLVGCGGIRVFADPFEAEVVARVFAAIGEARLPEPDPIDVTPALDEINRLKTALTDLARDHYADGRIERDEYFAARQVLVERIEEQRASIDRRQAPRVDLDDIEGRWEGMDILEQRAIVAELVDKVVVGPAVRGRNFFDPGRVSIEWR